MTIVVKPDGSPRFCVDYWHTLKYSVGTEDLADATSRERQSSISRISPRRFSCMWMLVSWGSGLCWVNVREARVTTPTSTFWPTIASASHKVSGILSHDESLPCGCDGPSSLASKFMGGALRVCNRSLYPQVPVPHAGNILQADAMGNRTSRVKFDDGAQPGKAP